MLPKAKIILVVLSLILAPSHAGAQAKPASIPVINVGEPNYIDGRELLNKCDAALNAKILEASLCAQGLDFRNKEIERLYKENETLRAKGTGLLDNPAVWAAIGVIAGAFATSRIVR